MHIKYDVDACNINMGYNRFASYPGREPYCSYQLDQRALSASNTHNTDLVSKLLHSSRLGGLTYDFINFQIIQNIFNYQLHLIIYF